MKGLEATRVAIYTAGVFVVGIVVTLYFTSETFFPGLRAQQINEDTSLGYQIINMVNILAVNERGSITHQLFKKHNIQVTQEEGGSKLKIGEREFEFLVPVQSTNFISDKGIAVTKFGGIVELKSI